LSLHADQNRRGSVAVLAGQCEEGAVFIHRCSPVS
jgi:hypothetical protein